MVQHAIASKLKANAPIAKNRAAVSPPITNARGIAATATIAPPTPIPKVAPIKVLHNRSLVDNLGVLFVLFISLVCEPICVNHRTVP